MPSTSNAAHTDAIRRNSPSGSVTPGNTDRAAAIRCALEGRPKQMSMVVPGRADRVLTAASTLGFRIDEPFILLSARPFGDWRHYLPSNPGFL